MELISNYMRDENSRHMLNALTEKVFGFNFESWVTRGYFEGDYIPYSFTEGDKIVSNVSANRMKFMQKGVEKNYIQIGTVMTDPDYRNQGLAAKLVKHVIEEYGKDCDGIYLFGNLGALDFYRKLGFKTLNQYRYFVKEEFCRFGTEKNTFKPIADTDEALRKKYLDLVRKGARYSSFEQVNKYGLQMFYTAGFDNVLYSEELDCFAVLEGEDDALILQAVVCEKKVALAEVLNRLESEHHKCILGFTPLEEDMEVCRAEIYDGADDYRLFYKGAELKAIEEDRLYFPDLSHA